MKTSTFFIRGMCCATEQSVIENKLRSMKEVLHFSINLIGQKLSVEFEGEQRRIINALKSIGFDAQLQSSVDARSWREKNASLLIVSLSSFTFFIGFTGAELFSSSIVQAIFLFSILTGGWKVYVKAFHSLRTRSLDMNVLMAIATLGAIALGEWKEAAAVIILYAFALLLEEKSLQRTRNAIQSLLHQSPQSANRISNNIEENVPVENIHVGDILLIRPGEIIPLDGIVHRGESTVNQSAITGESLPVEKSINQQVFAGSLNMRGALEISVTHLVTDSLHAKILQKIEEAQSEKAPSQQFVERFARIYTPAVILTAVVVGCVSPLVLNITYGQSLYRALVLMVVACPCALVISTPIAIVSALTQAARSGILIKGGRHLETLASLQAIAFDKTGTLTTGKFILEKIIPLSTLSSTEIFEIASVLEHRSEHHLASAFDSFEIGEKRNKTLPVIEEFSALPGKGVKGKIENKQYFAGNHLLVEEQGLCSPEVEAMLRQYETDGYTTIFLADEQIVLGLFAFRDEPKKESRSLVTSFHKEGIQQVIVLSGDNYNVTKKLSREIGADEFHAELLPEDKIATMNNLRKQFTSVAMVGDGINDAPALAAANVGIAMGTTGTDLAIETADVVLMTDDLRKISQIIRLSKKAVRIIKQNIAFALITKAAIFFLGINGSATLWMAILADDGAALLVIANSLRLLISNKKIEYE